VGHDYARRVTATTSAGGVDLGAVDALLAKRLKAKKARRFDDADALRAALKVPEFLDMAMQLGFSFYLLTELSTFF
jgi:cysteinyl-tRNA synthetase